MEVRSLVSEVRKSAVEVRLERVEVRLKPVEVRSANSDGNTFIQISFKWYN